MCLYGPWNICRQTDIKREFLSIARRTPSLSIKNATAKGDKILHEQNDVLCAVFQDLKHAQNTQEEDTTPITIYKYNQSMKGSFFLLIKRPYTNDENAIKQSKHFNRLLEVIHANEFT